MAGSQNSTPLDSHLPALANQESVKKLLPHTYYAFFAEFPKLTAIQQRATQPILEGKSCLLIAPTASGKTQAYMAPLIQRYYQELRNQSGCLLVISPTRALVNDLYRRLSPPLSRCGIEISRRSGDFRKAGDETFTGVVITTPESLDSILCRQARRLERVKAIVIDEVHLLAPTCRGSQVELLLPRLVAVIRALSANPQQAINLQTVCVSATIDNSEELSERFLVAEPSQRVVLREDSVRSGPVAPGQTPWQPEIVRRVTAPDIWQLLMSCFSGGQRKILFFLPTRKGVEDTAEALRNVAVQHSRAIGSNLIFVHHAALSRASRISSEQAFLKASQGVLLTTSSLEVGIDIGDIDSVLLWGAPKDVASLRQRIGRAGRRGKAARVFCLCSSDSEELELQFLLSQAELSLLHEDQACDYHSVLFQQAASLTFQNRGGFVSAAPWWQRLPRRWQSKFKVGDLENLLAHWEDRGFYTHRDGRYLPTERLHILHTRGKIHSNIEDGGTPEREVIESETGRIIGFVRVSQSDNSSPKSAQMVLGGARRRFMQTSGSGPLRTVMQTGAPPPAAASGKAAKSNIQIGSQSAPTRSRLLTQEYGKWIGLQPNQVVVGRIGGTTYCFHFLGTLWGQLMTDFLRYALKKTKHGGGLGEQKVELKDNGICTMSRVPLKVTELNALKIQWLEKKPDSTKLFLKKMSKLGRLCQCGPWFSQLPTDFQLQQLENKMDFQEFLKTLALVEFVAPTPELTGALQKLLTADS